MKHTKSKNWKQKINLETLSRTLKEITKQRAPEARYIYLPTSPLGQDMTQGQSFSGLYQV